MQVLLCIVLVMAILAWYTARRALMGGNVDDDGWE
jgi:hypothetical protein